MWAKVDPEGRLVLPAEFVQSFGRSPGTEDWIDAEINGLRMGRLITSLANISVEPTNMCNLTCRTCARNAWDGSLSPCLPLMHDLDSCLDETPRHSRRYVIGNISEHNLDALWEKPEHVIFRRKVQDFNFHLARSMEDMNFAKPTKKIVLEILFRPTVVACRRRT